MRAKLALAMVVAGVALAPLLALAGHAPVRDADDTAGRLDIRRVAVDDAGRATWTVSTWSRWRAIDIFDAGYVLVHLDTFGTPRFDYYALVRSTGTKLAGSLWRNRASKPDYRMRWLQTRRPDRKTVRVRIPLGRLYFGSRRLHYSWSAQTLYTGDACRQVCFDSAPDGGSVQEPRAVPVPTVSPTAPAAG